MIESILQELGLSDKETRIYLEIVKNEDATAGELAKNTHIERATVYDIIEKLLDKGLISKIIKFKKTTYQPVEFSKLLSKVKEQENLAILAITELNKMKLPSKKEYKVEIFEGKEGLKSFFSHLESLIRKNELKDYLALGPEIRTIDSIKFFLISRFKDINSFSKNVDFRVIWKNEVKDQALYKTLISIGKHKKLPKNIHPTTTITVFNEYTSIIFNTFTPIVIRIQNKEIADTFRGNFNYFWNTLK